MGSARLVELCCVVFADRGDNGNTEAIQHRSKRETSRSELTPKQSPVFLTCDLSVLQDF
jgi:hypothetical protein